MLLKDSTARALKGSLHYGMISIKNSYFIFTMILLGNVLMQAVIDLLMLQSGSNSNNNGGVLTVGFGTGMIYMFIVAIVMSGTKELKINLAFPVNRKIFSAVKLMIFSLMTFGFLLITSIGYLFEYIMFSGFGKIFSNFTYSTSLTLESFIAGFWISFCYILFVAAFTHLLFLLFYRFKLPAVAVFSLAAVVLASTAIGRRCVANAVMFFVGEQSMLLLSLKLIVGVLLISFLGYLVQRKMEVR